MMLIDSHSHLFLPEFSDDLPQVIARAQQAGVTHIFMPNIDSTTIEPLLAVCASYPGYCLPMIGLHPTSVNASYEEELNIVERHLTAPHEFVAIGEIGLDLYWDKSYQKQQIIAFEKQVEWALMYHLPIVIHCREASDLLMEVMQPYKATPLTGIFHSFTGTAEEASRLLEFPGFLIGINGVVTFKKSLLSEVIREIPLQRLVLETDSPYLTPAPNRGKRNESAYIKDTLIKVSDVYHQSAEVVSTITSENALKVFGMLK